MSLPRLRLKKSEDRRLRAGHLWVFSNEVDTRATPLTGFEPGAMADVEDSHGQVLGSAYVNPHSLICARLIARRPGVALDAALLTQRITTALALRERLFPTPHYRLVHGEGDHLPGLIVDRYGEVLVAQITTAGMDRVLAAVIAALQQAVRPAAIILRNDTAMRTLEGLAQYVETVLGSAPEQLDICENGVRFQVPALGGQKTGWFYDHRANRARMQAYVRERRVLDVFSYAGGWGVQAAAAGAREVLCIDSSQAALDQLQRNARLNQLDRRVRVQAGDAFEALKALVDGGERFDVVVLDPPAFIKRRKDVKEGLIAYRRLNKLALQLLMPGGVLISASCSYHLERQQLLEQIRLAQPHAHLQVLEQGHQAPDHPVHPAIPETDYLKAYFLRVLES